MTEQPETPQAPQQPETPDATAADAGQSFTQAQLDAIIAERLKRAKESNTQELLQTLGVEDLDTATKAIKEAAAAKQAQMSELEKAQAEVAAANEKAAKVEAEAKAIKATAEEALLRAAVMSAATMFNDASDAWLHIDRSRIEVQADGTYKGIDEAIKAVIEAKPYLARQGQQPNLGTPTPARKRIAQTWQTQQTKTEQSEPPRRPLVRF